MFVLEETLDERYINEIEYISWLFILKMDATMNRCVVYKIIFLFLNIVIYIYINKNF